MANAAAAKSVKSNAPRSSLGGEPQRALSVEGRSGCWQFDDIGYGLGDEAF
jgi:hypothetical protein